MTINKIFGKRVKEERLALNLSQEKLANMADIDRTYLPDIENGKRNVSLVVAEKIAKALNVPLINLLKNYDSI
ncbi:MAG: helix-turn-helix domain-containing protein [Odoribacter sp.]|nr:helix-turn-helix domain-containing protein [Odoribacter sp.]